MRTYSIIIKNSIGVFSLVLLMSSSASQLPFAETFEAVDGVVVGTIDGQNGWVLESGTAQNASVQSNGFQSGFVDTIHTNESTGFYRLEAQMEQHSSLMPMLIDQ